MQAGLWTVGPDTVRMLELGHPWIVADSYTKKWPKGRAGDLVELTDDKGRFLATALLDPQDRIVARVLAREPIRLDRAWLKKRLAVAIDLRRSHADLGDTDAYRLVNAEGDGLLLRRLSDGSALLCRLAAAPRADHPGAAGAPFANRDLREDAAAKDQGVGGGE
jgi:23S rRNA G2069 N7-methylase RlmK/C1962 C5-methylase RlmI